MNAACTAAVPSSSAAAGAVASSSTTPPLANTAHFRLGRTSRRSSSSGSSSSSSNGFATNGGGGNNASAPLQQGVSASRKRRRHSTLSSGIASGSEEGEEGERAPPMFRLRLGSYVSDLRLARTRSQSPGSPLLQQASGAPVSPSGAVRLRHQLSIQTTAAMQQKDQQQQEGASAVTPAASMSVSPTSMIANKDSDVEMDLDVQSTFQAMQVDSPTASPSPTIATSMPFFAAISTREAPSPPPPAQASAASTAMQRTVSAASGARLSPIPSSLLTPLVTDTRYPPRAASPLSAPASASFPAISLAASNDAAAVSPGVFPSASVLAARRSSIQSASLGMASQQAQQQQQHAPASPSPLARMLSFPPPTQTSTASSQDTLPHQHQHFDSIASTQHQDLVSFQLPIQSQSQSQQQTQNQTRSRSSSTPPSPVVGAVASEGQHPPPAIAPLSPLRRHSDGPPPSRVRY